MESTYQVQVHQWCCNVHKISSSIAYREILRDLFFKPFPFKMLIGVKLMLDKVSKTNVNLNENWILYTRFSDEGLQMKVYTLAWQETWVPVCSSYCFVHTRE